MDVSVRLRDQSAERDWVFDCVDDDDDDDDDGVGADHGEILYRYVYGIAA